MTNFLLFNLAEKRRAEKLEKEIESAAKK